MAKGVNIKSAWAFKKGPSAQGHDEVRKQSSMPANTYDMWADWWLSTSFAFTKDFTDSLSISDSVANAFDFSQSDTLSLSDLLTNSPDLAINDSYYLSDDKSFELNKSLAEDLYLTESLVREFLIQLSSGSSLSDSASTEQFVNRFLNISDSLSISDSIGKSTERQLSDLISITETLSRVLDKSASDNYSIQDEVIKSYVRNLILSDTLSLNDQLVKEFNISKDDLVSFIETNLTLFLDRIPVAMNKLTGTSAIVNSSMECRKCLITTTVSKQTKIVSNVNKNIIINASISVK